MPLLTSRRRQKVEELIEKWQRVNMTSGSVGDSKSFDTVSATKN